MAKARAKAAETPISTRPASIKPRRNPFIQEKKKAGSKKIGINWDRVEESGNHKLSTEILTRQMVQLRLELQEAERLGQPKARRIRRDINKLLEQELALQSTWCQGCMNYAHRCKCDGIVSKEALRSRARRRKAREERIGQRMQNALQAFRAKFNIQEA